MSLAFPINPRLTAELMGTHLWPKARLDRARDRAVILRSKEFEEDGVSSGSKMTQYWNVGSYKF